MRTFSLLAALCIIVTRVTVAQPGYLAAGYPAPLRFTAPQSRQTGTLPPLPKPETEASFPIPTNTMNQAGVETVVSSGPSNSEQPGMIGPPPEVAPPFVTPEMLMGYFHGGNSGNSNNNHNNVTAVVPFGFMPPASGPPPGPPPSSSATYISR